MTILPRASRLVCAEQNVPVPVPVPVPDGVKSKELRVESSELRVKGEFRPPTMLKNWIPNSQL